MTMTMRLLRFRHMMVGLVVLAGCAETMRSQVSVADVRDALVARYPKKKSVPVGNFSFDESKPVQMLDLPALAKSLPDVRFFVTELRTTFYEYPEVSVAIAAQQGRPLAVELSPTYAKTEPEFVAQLKRAKLRDISEQEAVAEEISSLFRAITGDGTIRSQQFSPDLYTAKLWCGEQYWRLILIKFADGQIESITLKNPKATTRP
jgi:hypothetical protein